MAELLISARQTTLEAQWRDEDLRHREVLEARRVVDDRRRAVDEKAEQLRVHRELIVSRCSFYLLKIWWYYPGYWQYICATCGCGRGCPHERAVPARLGAPFSGHIRSPGRGRGELFHNISMCHEIALQ